LGNLIESALRRIQDEKEAIENSSGDIDSNFED